jgi:hypothetical protein
LDRWLKDWALGYGAVCLHMAIFLVTSTAIVLVQLYRTPDHLSLDLVRTWGSIVALHGLAVTVVQSVRWAIAEEQASQQGQAAASQPAETVTVAVPADIRIRSWWQATVERWRQALDPVPAPVPAAAALAEAPMETPAAVEPARSEPAAHPSWPTRRATSLSSAPATAAPTPSTNGEDGDASSRWSWMEAAATAWLAQGGEPLNGLHLPPAEAPSSGPGA